MIKPYEQLDRRFAELRPLAEKAARPSRGWIRALRDALGMTTAQLAKRIGVTQSRVVEMEKFEISGSLSLANLERAAEAMDCRVVYLFVPIRPLTETIQTRAREMADQQLSAVEQTMQLENQGINPGRRAEMRNDIIDKLLSRPARLWDTL